ncbi:MAG TPA: mechanosensitive ion channel family protein [Gammaproteobacteria bacterium]|nr:mechanosensitive ion channel family protein [Gammaproteobacteria bacterium]
MLDNIISHADINTFINFIKIHSLAPIIFISSLISAFIINKLINKLFIGYIKQRKHNHPTLDKALVQSLAAPISLGIYLNAILFSATWIFKHYKTDVTAITKFASPLVIMLLSTWFLIRLTNSYEQCYLHDKKSKGATVDRTLVHAVSQLIKFTLFISASLVILDYFKVGISGLLTFGGIGGIAVGLSAKDLLANFFGSLVIYLDRPFQIGDWVRSPDRNIEGTVIHIGWRVTVVSTFEKRPLYIPNATFTSIIVENPSRMSNRRIKELIGIRYEDIPEAREILKNIRSMLASHEDIDQKQTQMVFLDHFCKSSVNILVYTFTKTTNWKEYLRIKEDVLLKISDIIEHKGASIAYPTSVIHFSPNIDGEEPPLPIDK